MNTRARGHDLNDLLTVEDFLALVEDRPDGEKWELVEGVAVLHASPIDYHQIVVSNLIVALDAAKVNRNATWLPLPGIGLRVTASPNSLPQPDVFVLQGQPTGRATTDDAVAIFEVLSPGNTRSDQAWRRKVYASVPNCQHYVTISLKAIEVIAHDRSSGWQARQMTDIGLELALPALDIGLPLARLYRYTPFAAPS